MAKNISSLKFFSSGLVLGAAFWAITPLLFSKPMPLDSHLATYSGVAAMSAFSGYIGYRFGFGKALVSVLGLYIGQVGYCYIFLLHNGWIIAVAISTLFFLVATVIAASVGAAIGFTSRSRHQEEQQ